MEEWRSALASHPDTDLVQLVLQGISQGFRIGFDYGTKRVQCCAHGNMSSALDNPVVVDCYLQEELSLGSVVGPLIPELARRVHTSPFRVIPKGHTLGKWRLIVDLSSPAGKSVNDGISVADSSLSYMSVDDVAKVVVQMGEGALLGKADVQSAYRIIPVHPEDRWLLGMQWQGRVFVDTYLPFGLRSAPIIFTAVADAPGWIVKAKGVRMLRHYLDDFITVGAPATGECLANDRPVNSLGSH